MSCSTLTCPPVVPALSTPSVLASGQDSFCKFFKVRKVTATVWIYRTVQKTIEGMKKSCKLRMLSEMEIIIVNIMHPKIIRESKSVFAVSYFEPPDSISSFGLRKFVEELACWVAFGEPTTDPPLIPDTLHDGEIRATSSNPGPSCSSSGWR